MQIDENQPLARLAYFRNATLSGGAGDADSDPWTPFFGDIVDFWRSAKFSFSECSIFGHGATYTHGYGSVQFAPFYLPISIPLHFSSP